MFDPNVIHSVRTVSRPIPPFTCTSDDYERHPKDEERTSRNTRTPHYVHDQKDNKTTGTLSIGVRIYCPECCPICHPPPLPPSAPPAT